MDLKSLIRTIPDFPEPGIQFKDIESITENPPAFQYVIDQFAEAVRGSRADKILALDARGFLFGAALGIREELPLVMARKKGKLGGDCVAQDYMLEYGQAEVELQTTAINPGERIAIVDDLLATGGTASAAASLVQQLQGSVELFAFVIELEGLDGRTKLNHSNVMSLVTF